MDKEKDTNFKKIITLFTCGTEDHQYKIIKNGLKNEDKQEIRTDAAIQKLSDPGCRTKITDWLHRQD
jgi:hypothetical protein